MQTQATIGYLLKGYPRLSETFILNEIFQLEQSGLQLEIFALRNPQESHVHETVKKIKAPVTYISDYPWRFWQKFLSANLRLFFSKPLTYLQSLKQAIQYSLQQRDSSPFKRFVQAAFMVKVHLEKHPSNAGGGITHLHAHFANDPTSMAYFVQQLSSIPFSFTAHAKDIYTQDQDFLQRKIGAAKFVITCTHYNHQLLTKLGKDGTPIHPIYHGIDLDTFKSKPHIQFQATPHILSVGRLVPKKGFLILLDALHILASQGLDFCCNIVGDGPQQAELQQRIDQLGLNGRVNLLGKMSQTTLRTHYETADIMALACQITEDGDRDGIPNVLVEAMAMGIPIVSTNISGIPELVEHNVTGLLAAQKDASGLAQALKNLILQPELGQELAQAGQDKIIGQFNVEANARRVSTLFHNVTNSQKHQPTMQTPRNLQFDSSKIHS